MWSTVEKRTYFKMAESLKDEILFVTWTLKRISERPAAKVESHGLFEGEADGRKVCDTRTRLNVGERCAERLAIPEDSRTKRTTTTM